jgi:hypothetical protein
VDPEGLMGKKLRKKKKKKDSDDSSITPSDEYTENSHPSDESSSLNLAKVKKPRKVRKEPFTEAEIQEAFQTFDLNGNGFVGPAEIRFVMDALGEQCTDEEIDEMIRMIDVDLDAQVNYREFYKMASGHTSAPAKVKSMAEKKAEEAIRKEEEKRR